MSYKLPRLNYLLIGLIFITELLVIAVVQPDFSTKEGTNTVYLLLLGAGLAGFLWKEPWNVQTLCDLFFEFETRLVVLSSDPSISVRAVSCGKISIGRVYADREVEILDSNNQLVRRRFGEYSNFCREHDPRLSSMQEWLKQTDTQIYYETLKEFRFAPNRADQ